MKFRQHHLTHLISQIKIQKTPLDVLLRHYFRLHKALGSKDRAWIAETLYNYVRWKNLYDELQLDPMAPLPDLNTFPLAQHLRLGAPEKLFLSLRQSYGEKKTAEICHINQTRAPVTLRANRLKISRDELLRKLSSQFDVQATLVSPLGIQCSSKINFAALPEFKDGLFEVQDEASQLAAQLIRPSLNTQILDYCAGAGGKSLAFAPEMQQSGQLYLHDIRHEALQEAKKRLRRAGIQNGQFKLPYKKKSLDWVVVDVPCSGTGTYRRNPDLKWKFESLNLAQLTQEQQSIFEEALSYLHPKGTIVYMTCSILPEENEHQAAYFQKKYSLQIVDQFQTLPLLHGMDGFYAVSFKII